MTPSGRLDLRTVIEADVYIDDELAGHLVREPSDAISFDYLAELRATETRIRERSVSLSLLRSGRISRRHHGWVGSPLLRRTTSGRCPARRCDVVDENLSRRSPYFVTCDRLGHHRQCSGGPERDGAGASAAHVRARVRH